MYEQANESINQGLSLGARLLLGSVSGLFGVVMFLTAPPTDKAQYFYLFGGFCLLISLACFTKGRVRQFVGSMVGSAIFILGLVYLGSELTAGAFLSESRAKPSVLNAVLYLVFIGLPGATYAYKVKFGFRAEP